MACVLHHCTNLVVVLETDVSKPLWFLLKLELKVELDVPKIFHILLNVKFEVFSIIQLMLKIKPQIPNTILLLLKVDFHVSNLPFLTIVGLLSALGKVLSQSNVYGRLLLPNGTRPYIKHCQLSCMTFVPRSNNSDASVWFMLLTSPRSITATIC